MFANRTEFILQPQISPIFTNQTLKFITKNSLFSTANYTNFHKFKRRIYKRLISEIKLVLISEIRGKNSLNYFK